MWFQCVGQFLWGERCVTSQETAAKETTCGLTSVRYLHVEREPAIHLSGTFGTLCNKSQKSDFHIKLIIS